MRKWLTTALDLCGASLIVAGVAMIWVPAACMVAGGGLLLISWRASR